MSRMSRSLIVVGIIVAVVGGIYFFYFKKTPPPVVKAPVSQHRLAPPGVLYLTQRVAITTDSGITGYAPGTAVRFVSEGSSGVRVRDGSDEFLVQRSQLTNDLDIVARIRKADLRNQTQIQRGIIATVDAANANNNDTAELARQEARLNYLELDEIRLKNAVRESPQRSVVDAPTLRKFQSIQNEITRTKHLIEELRMKIKADEVARHGGPP